MQLRNPVKKSHLARITLLPDELCHFVFDPACLHPTKKLGVFKGEDGHVSVVWADTEISLDTGLVQPWRAWFAPLSPNSIGYPLVNTPSVDGKRASAKAGRLVALALGRVPPDPSYQGHHIDGNNSNFQPGNLRWMSHSERARAGWVTRAAKKSK